MIALDRANAINSVMVAVSKNSLRLIDSPFKGTVTTIV